MFASLSEIIHCTQKPAPRRTLLLSRTSPRLFATCVEKIQFPRGSTQRERPGHAEKSRLLLSSTGSTRTTFIRWFRHFLIQKGSICWLWSKNGGPLDLAWLQLPGISFSAVLLVI